MPDGKVYFCIDRAFEKGIEKHAMPYSFVSIGLGCDVIYAKDLIYSDGMDIEYKKLAEKNGCSFYKRVPALGIEENFIKGLAELVLQQETRGNFVSSVMCPSKYKKCPCQSL